MYLYHATSKKYLDNTLREGLVLNPPHHNFSDMYCENKIYLAFSTDAAREYFKFSGNKSSDCVVLRVDFDKLSQNSFEYDWNNRCEYERDIDSVVYLKDIPPECITIFHGEDSQCLDDFKDTKMYWTIIDTFYEEVETNLEESDEYH